MIRTPARDRPNAHRLTILALLKLADLAVFGCAFAIAIHLALPSRHWLAVGEPSVSIRNVLLMLAYVAYWHVVLRAFGLYRASRLAPNAREGRSLGLAVLVGTASVALFSAKVHLSFASWTFAAGFFVVAFVGLATERRLLRRLARHWRGRRLRSVIVVGDGDSALQTAACLARRADLGYRVVDIVGLDPLQAAGAGAVGDTTALQLRTSAGDATVLERVSALLARHSIDEVFVSVPLDSGQPLLRAIIPLCEEQGVTLRVVSSVADLTHARAHVDVVEGGRVVTISSGPPDSILLSIKRAVDIVVASLALLVSAPVMLLTVLAIWLTPRGPALFVQERVGLSGRRFKFYKFRTMVPDAERLQAGLESLNEAQGPIFKIRKDPRITRIGRLIRRLSIDELPQLFNVLKGDMSIVGPRPLPVRDVTRIDVRAHRRRFSVKPGITCLWQVNGREPSFDDWIETDMEYIDNWSLGLDFRIMMRTIPAVLGGRGAY
jgi:exopolysaccharide biosynthesis polyprenyl glycosylphosphotransferase